MSFEKYRQLKEPLESLCRLRRGQILQQMTEKDAEYRRLCRDRAGKSMFLRKALGESCLLLEDYTDAVFAQESYELDAVYRQAVLDTLELLSQRGLI